MAQRPKKLLATTLGGIVGGILFAIAMKYALGLSWPIAAVAAGVWIVLWTPAFYFVFTGRRSGRR